MFIEEYVYLKGDIMDNSGIFTEQDLAHYEQAAGIALNFLKRELSEFFKGDSVRWLDFERVKKLDSINTKIAKKKKEKGDNFDYYLDLLDIAGIRIVFCDEKNYIRYKDNVQALTSEISEMTPYQFISRFNEACFNSDNYSLDPLYSFVGHIMKKTTTSFSYPGLKSDLSIKIDMVKDYIKYQKDSGYQSIHLIINVAIPFVDDDGMTKIVRYPVEIQIRNFAQHLYDEREHDIRYKKKLDEKSLYNASDFIDVFNASKDFFKKQFMDYQEKHKDQDLFFQSSEKQM